MSVFIIVMNVVVLVGIVFYLYKKSTIDALKPFFFPALLLKLLCGVLLGVLYFSYYGEGDTILYYTKALLGADILYQGSLQPYLKYLFLDEVPRNSLLAAIQVPYYSSAWNMIKLVSIPLALTNGNYYLCALYLSAFSFAGAWFLVQKLSVYFPGTAKAAAAAFLFFPSVVFWSSGVIKESFIMGGMGLLVGSFLVLRQPDAGRKKIRYAFFALIGILLIWYVKYFVAIALGAFLMFAVILKYIQTSKMLSGVGAYWKGAMLVVLFAGIAFAVSRLNYNLNFQQLPLTVYDNYLKYTLTAGDKPSINLPSLKPAYYSFVLHAPLAFTYMLFRPFVWEIYNTLTFVAAIENLLVLMLTILFCKDAISGKVNISQNNAYLLLVTICYILLMGTLLAYSMPNLGTLSRYKVVFLPFLIYLLFLSPSNYRYLSRFNIKESI